MRTRPAPLLAIAFIQLIAPFGSLWVGSIISNIPLWHYIALYFKASPIDLVWGLFGVQFLAAFAVYSMKKWSLPVVIGCSFFQIATSSWGGVTGLNFQSALLFIGAHFLNLALIAYFLLPQVRAIYMNKSLRWWESKPRYTVDCHASIFLGRQHGHQNGKLKEISLEGAFVSDLAMDLQVGDLVVLEFAFEGNQEIFKSKVVLRMGASIGLKFCDLSRSAKKRLKDLVRHLEYSDVPRKPERSNAIDDFRSWLGHFARTGQGIVPGTMPVHQEFEVLKSVRAKSKSHASPQKKTNKAA